MLPAKLIGQPTKQDHADCSASECREVNDKWLFSNGAAISGERIDIVKRRDNDVRGKDTVACSKEA